MNIIIMILITLLKKYLYYDIEINAGKNTIDKFEKLQLLNVLFLIENEGYFPNGEKYPGENGFPLINILAKPRLENINSVYSKNTKYGKYIDMVIYNIGNKIDPIGTRKFELDSINGLWDDFMLRVFQYCNLDIVYDFPEFHLNQLKGINEFLAGVLKLLKKYSKFETDNTGKLTINVRYKEGVLKTFYNILLYNTFRSFDNYFLSENKLVFHEDKKNLNSETYNLYKGVLVNVNTVSLLLEYLKNDDSSLLTNDCDNLLMLIKLNIEADDEKYIQLALENINPLLRLFEIQTEVDFTQGIDITLLAAIVQEIICVHKTKPTVLNDYLGYSTGEISLKSFYTRNKNSKSYKDCEIDKESALVKIAWIERIMNRSLINLGFAYHITQYIKAKKAISEIKNELFYYTNFEDVVGITNVIS